MAESRIREKKQLDPYNHIEFVWAGKLRRYRNVHVTRCVAVWETIFWLISNFRILNSIIAYAKIYLYSDIVGKMVDLYIK